MKRSVSGLEQRTGNLESNVGLLRTQVEALRTEVNQLTPQVAGINQRVAVLERQVGELVNGPEAIRLMLQRSMNGTVTVVTPGGTVTGVVQAVEADCVQMLEANGNVVLFKLNQVDAVNR